MYSRYSVWCSAYLHEEANHQTADLSPLVIEAEGTGWRETSSEHIHTYAHTHSLEVIMHDLAEVHVGVDHHWVTRLLSLMAAWMTSHDIT